MRLKKEKKESLSKIEEILLMRKMFIHHLLDIHSEHNNNALTTVN